MSDRAYMAVLYGRLVPDISGATAKEVREKILSEGQRFTAHDKWEKAIRHGWSVVAVVPEEKQN